MDGEDVPDISLGNDSIYDLRSVERQSLVDVLKCFNFIAKSIDIINYGRRMLFIMCRNLLQTKQCQFT